MAAAVKFAVTVLGPDIVTLQVGFVPLQVPPDQEEKTCPDAGVAVSVT